MSAVAIVLALCAAVAHASWNVIAHGVSRSGVVFLWCGSVVSTAIWLPIAVLTGGFDIADWTGFALGVGVSAILHVGYMIILQRGYAAGGLSTVYAVARGTGPLLTVIFAIAVWGEQLSLLAVLGVAAVIGGVVAMGLIDRDRAPRIASLDRPKRARLDRGILYGLLTGVAIATYTLWDTHSLRTWDISPIAFMAGCTLLEIPLFTLLLGRRLPAVVPMLRAQWRRLLAFGTLSPLSYILVLTAVTIAPVSLVAPLREVSVVLVSLFGAFVLREKRPGVRLVASAVVVVGVGLLAV